MPDVRSKPANERRGPALILRLDGGLGRPRDLRGAAALALALTMSAVGGVDPAHRGLLWAAAVMAMAAALYARAGGDRREATGGGEPAWLVLDDSGVARVDVRGRTSLASWNAPFGLSILADAARKRALLTFTTPTATRLLGLRLDTPRDEALARDLLEHATTVAESDLDAAEGVERDACLGAASVKPFLDELARREPRALQRLYLSDARGAAIVVDGDTLTVGERSFDLSCPVDWRVFAFLEGEQGAAAVYQATQLRQGGAEAVFVCRASAELSSWSPGRLSDAPPSRDSRVAIDRLFMTPIRAALAQAPRLPRPGAPSSRSRGRRAET